MTEAALALSIAAMVLAVATIFFDILFYRWQTEQGARITGTVNDFAKEMHGVLGEIKGLTTGTRQELQEQFKFLLQAAIGQERVSIGEGLEERVATIEQRVAGVEERSQATDDAELTTIVGQLKRDVSSLQEGLTGLRQGAGAAGVGAFLDRPAVEIAEAFLSSGRTSLLPLSPATQAEMTLLLHDLAAGAGDDAAWLTFRYGEAFKAAERARLIETYLKPVKPDRVAYAIRLTEAGRTFLGAGPPAKNGAVE